MELTEFLEAYNRIKPYVYKTPMKKSYAMSNSERTVYLKLECQQITNSFKPRGAFNKILKLSDAQREKGLFTISSGNHGIAVSYAAHVLGIKNTIVYLPEVTPKAKIDKIKNNGAHVEIKGIDYDECHALGIKFLEQSGLTYIDPYDKDYDVYAGAGTISIEILFDHPEIDTILVPVSGGGLVTGIGLAAKKINPNIKVIGLQTEACPAFYKSFHEKIFYPELPCTETVCEALMGGAGVEPYKWCHESMDELLMITEKSIKEATRIIFNEDKILCEPSSAIGIAAMIEQPKAITGKNIAIVVSGGNVNQQYFKLSL